ncbi:MAG: nitroreductase family protein [Acidimicrobiales bacterium]
MDFAAIVRTRRMVRAFRGEPVAPEVLDRVLDAGRRAPAAGNTDGRAFVALIGQQDTARYWDVTLPAGAARDGFRWQGLLRAPVLVIVCASPDAYVARYAEPDKASTGLGARLEGWATPYWTVDAAFATMRVLDACVAEGLGACFFGLFDHEAAVKAAFGIPEPWQAIGTVAIGHPEGAADELGRSATRARPTLADVVHRGAW